MFYVLVADDDPGVARVIALSLDLANLAVRLAHTVDYAIAAMIDEAPEPVVMDIRMPDLPDPSEFISWIRHFDPALPVIVCTARLGDYGGLGIQGVVHKPFVPDVLADQVRDVLTSRYYALE